MHGDHEGEAAAQLSVWGERLLAQTPVHCLQNSARSTGTFRVAQGQRASRGLSAFVRLPPSGMLCVASLPRAFALAPLSRPRLDRPRISSAASSG